jgi:hypothetical protein
MMPSSLGRRLSELSYVSTKEVHIYDLYLVFIYYSAVLACLVYTVAVTLIRHHGYLTYDDVDGSLKVLLVNPAAGFKDVLQRPYCSGGTTSCRIWDEHDVRYPNTDTKTVLLTSMVRTCEQFMVCSGNSSICDEISPYSNRDCSTNGTSFFVAGLENFTLEINHTVQAPELYAETRNAAFRSEGAKMAGKVIKHNKGGDKIVLRDIPLGEADRFSVLDMLQFAGLQEGLESRLLASQHSTIRTTGCVIFVTLRYSNIEGLSTGQIKYEYEFSEGIGPETMYIPRHYSSSEAVRVLELRNGIKLVFQQQGQLGKFSVNIFLLTFVTGLGLLSVAQTATDAIAVYILPQRTLYRAAKYEEVKLSPVEKGYTKTNVPVEASTESLLQ